MENISGLDSQQLICAIRAFFPYAHPHVLSTHAGEINRIVIFSNEGEEYVLRIKKKPFPENNLEFERTFLDQLKTFKLPITVPDVFPTASGATFFTDSEHFYTMMSRVPGSQRFSAWHETHLYSDRDVEQGFRILGQLHNVYRKVNIDDTKHAPTVFELLDIFESRIAQPNIPIGKILDYVKREGDYMTSKIIEIRNRLNSHNYRAEPLYPVHYDINYTNVLWKNERIVGLIDFDWAQYSTTGFDFAQMCKLTCGGFSLHGITNDFDERKLLIAVTSYNKTSEVPIQADSILRALLDTSSLFLAHWAIETYANEKREEDYYLTFFKAGVDRVRQKIELK